MRPSLGRTIAAGFVGTTLITLMMYYVAPLMTGEAMDVAGMLGGLLGASWMVGMIGHFVMGALILPSLYALFLFRWLRGTPAVRGLAWGLILWSIAQAVVMPSMGGGFFSAQAGGFMVALSSLIGHVLYGLSLGLLSGGPHGAPTRDTMLHEPRLRRAG